MDRIASLEIWDLPHDFDLTSMINGNPPTIIPVIMMQ
jgi:hypothetical protein